MTPRPAALAGRLVAFEIVAGQFNEAAEVEPPVVLKPEHRMRRSSEFSTTVRQGVRVGRRLIVVHIARPDRSDAAVDDVATPIRVGFVVGRAVGGAAVRNAVRRRLRHLMADRLPDLPAGAQVVVRALPHAAHSSSSALAHELESALTSARTRLEVAP